MVGGVDAEGSCMKRCIILAEVSTFPCIERVLIRFGEVARRLSVVVWSKARGRRETESDKLLSSGGASVGLSFTRSGACATRRTWTTDTEIRIICGIVMAVRHCARKCCGESVVMDVRR